MGRDQVRSGVRIVLCAAVLMMGPGLLGGCKAYKDVAKVGDDLSPAKYYQTETSRDLDAFCSGIGPAPYYQSGFSRDVCRLNKTLSPAQAYE